MFDGQRLPTALGNNVHQQLTVTTVSNKVIMSAFQERFEIIDFVDPKRKLTHTSTENTLVWSYVS